MKVYNTLSRQEEEFRPIGDPVRMYVCGITPYSTSHIGHAMSYIVFDVVRRYLEYRGYRVKHVQNFTDIDDKIIARANEQGIPASQLAEKYIAEFFEDMDLLNIKRADVYPRATGEVPEIIKLVGGLVDEGYAYVLEGDVYFRVDSKADYGKLSHRSLDEMRAGARVEVEETKENPLDFALWKEAKPGEPSWDSPWGKGRPGWHIECSAMSTKYLGEQIDIHGGGQDLIFPHHENEIAQSEAYTGKVPFARYWMHNGLLQLRGEKMSKSIGNLVTIREAVQEHGADSLRLFVLGSHYRSPLTYTEDSAASAKRGAERLRLAMQGYRPGENGSPAMREAAANAENAFVEAMDDDFNTSLAVASLFDLAREINRAREAGAGPSDLSPAQGKLLELSQVLGLTMKEPVSTAMAAAPFIELLLEVRHELRAARQFAVADKIRQRLGELGITVEDRPDGTSWRPSA
ncbi:MAG: cysteine--tRNA ligase [Chloroflexi bacterium]|nr:cysteine--tRNA ligase [Chloroflexota bacterium]